MASAMNTEREIIYQFFVDGIKLIDEALEKMKKAYPALYDNDEDNKTRENDNV